MTIGLFKKVGLFEKQTLEKAKLFSKSYIRTFEKVQIFESVNYKKFVFFQKIEIGNWKKLSFFHGETFQKGFLYNFGILNSLSVAIMQLL